MTDPASFTTLPGNLSLSRVKPYVDAEGGDLDRALRLYTWNVEVSSAFWGVLHAVEVGLRNAMNSQMAQRFGRDDWWHAANLTHVGEKVIDGAIESADKAAKRRGRPTVPDDVVAALPFGFWSGLTGPGGKCQYETQFWQPALVRAFPNLASQSRPPAHSTLETIRLFRNRVAHHEPIFRRHLAADHKTLLDVAGWIDPDLERYISAQSRVPATLGRRHACVSTGVSTSF